jgi:hypothetical protein
MEKVPCDPPDIFLPVSPPSRKKRELETSGGTHYILRQRSRDQIPPCRQPNALKFEEINCNCKMNVIKCPGSK